jgi:hypothetical protein
MAAFLANIAFSALHKMMLRDSMADLASDAIWPAAIFEQFKARLFAGEITLEILDRVPLHRGLILLALFACSVGSFGDGGADSRNAFAFVESHSVLDREHMLALHLIGLVIRATALTGFAVILDRIVTIARLGRHKPRMAVLLHLVSERDFKSLLLPCAYVCFLLNVLALLLYQNEYT